jgi:uncharacterized protein involved in response to NO
MQTEQNYFLSQPHQPFFALGIFNALSVMLLFFMAYKGVVSLTIDTTLFHIYSLAFLVFHNLFTGFLFTTFPRFNQSAIIEKNYYVRLFYLNVFASLLFMAGVFIHLYLTLFAMFLLFLSEIFNLIKLQSIYKNGAAPDKNDSFWILVANYFGLVGHLVLLCVVAFKLDFAALFGIYITFYLYLIFLAFSVGQRMIPFFSHSWAEKNPNFVKIVLVLFVFKVLFATFGIASAEIVTDILLAIYMLREFLRWELHPLQSPSILWVLHLALFWLPTAFGLSAISLLAEIFFETSLYFFNIHLLALGFLTTVLVGFGTRVILGHAGVPPQADAFTTKIFLFVQAVVLLRSLLSLNVAFGWDMAYLFDISVFAWIMLFGIWGGKYARLLIFGKQV